MNTFKKEEKEPREKKEAGKVSRSLANIFSGNFLPLEMFSENVINIISSINPFLFSQILL